MIYVDQFPYSVGAVGGSSPLSGGQGKAVVYAGACITPNAEIRSIWFSARSDADALEFCSKNGFACIGQASFKPNNNAERDAFDAKEVMRRLDVSRSTIYRLVARGELQRLRGVGAVRITRLSLERYLESQAAPRISRGG